MSAPSRVDVPLRDGSGHVSLPTGSQLPVDVSQVMSLLTRERASLGTWVSLGAEYYLAGKLGEALELFLAAEKAAADESLRAADEQGAVAIKVALGTYYSREAIAARRRDDDMEAERLTTLAQRHLEASLNFGHIESDLPWLGDGLFQLACQKDFRAARSRFDAALDLSDKKSHFGLLGMACCEFSKGNYEMALGSYVEALKTPEKCSPAVRIGLAHCFYRLGDHAMAERAFARVRELDPNNVQAAIGLALLRLNRSSDSADPENVQAAMHLLRDAYVDDEANPMALNHLAAHFFWKGELDRVKDFCMQSYKATTHDGMRRESLLLLARAHHRAQDYTRAKRYYNDALQAHSDHAKRSGSAPTVGTSTDKFAGQPPVLLLVGLAQMDLVEGKTEEAVMKFEEALKRAPDCKELILALGALHKTKRPKNAKVSRKSRGALSRASAVKFLKKAIELDAGNVDAQLEMAELTQSVGTEQHYKQALRHYKKAEVAKIRVNEAASSQIHNNVSVLHFQLGDTSAATQAMKRALKEALRETGGGEADESLLAKLASPAEEAGAATNDMSSSSSSSASPLSSAVRMARAILSVYGDSLYQPEKITLAYNLARLFEQTKAVAQARTVYSELIRKFPLYPDPHMRLAEIEAEAGDLDTALARVQDALSVRPGDKVALSLQGNLHLRAGNLGAAKTSFETILSALMAARAKQSSSTARKSSKTDPYAMLSLGNIDFARASSTLSREEHGALSSDVKGRLQNSLQMYKRVLDQDVKNAYAANGIGMVLAELGHKEKAAKIFTAVNDATPNMLQSRANLAHLHMSNGRYLAACQLYELCADRCKSEKKAEYLTCLARAQTSVGMTDPEKFDNALATLDKIKSVTPNDVNLGFNRAIVLHNFAYCIVEKARVEWAKQKDRAKKNLTYCTSSWIRRAKEMMESALELFEAAENAINCAGDDAMEKGFLFSSKDSKARAHHASQLLASGGTIPFYLAHAEKEDKREDAARKLAQKKLADQERQEAAARRNIMEQAELEKKEREHKANELMKKAMERNEIEARESKAVKEKKARRKSTAKKRMPRDRGERIRSDEERSDDTSSDSSSDSDSDSDGEESRRRPNLRQSRKRSLSAVSSASPVKKKAKTNRLELFSESDSDSESDDDDDMLSGNKPVVDAAAVVMAADAAASVSGTGSREAVASAAPEATGSVAPSSEPAASSSLAAMMDDDDEED